MSVQKQRVRDAEEEKTTSYRLHLKVLLYHRELYSLCQIY